MEETLEILQDNLGQALIDTAYMVVVSAIIGVVLGTLVALLLYLTENRLFTPNHALNVIVGFIVNAIRSLPFLILMVVLIPVVQLILGDPYTPTGGAISLSIAAAANNRDSSRSGTARRARCTRPESGRGRPSRGKTSHSSAPRRYSRSRTAKADTGTHRRSTRRTPLQNSSAPSPPFCL